jgi:thioredoxin reductase (NADPH)
MIYDVIIIGGGPAGLTAGIYTTRALMKTLLLEKIAPGGLVVTTANVENYPGFADGINGYDLMDQMIKQAQRFGVEIVSGETLGISQKDGVFHVKTSANEYLASSVIIASGTVYRKLDVEGEALFTGRGVSYCGICDAPLFRSKVVAVAGGGDTAVEEALFLTRFASKVYLVHRRDKLRASAILQAEAMQNKKIEFVWNATITGIFGRKPESVSPARIEKITLDSTVGGGSFQLNVDGVFIFIGFYPNTSFLKGFISLDREGYIITGSDMRTSFQGVFAAGDVRSNALRQIVTACGDGAMAAVSAQHFIENIKAGLA